MLSSHDEIITAVKSCGENGDNLSRWREKHPHLDRLQEEFGPNKAWRISVLLQQIREHGIKYATSSFSKSKKSRLIRELRELGLAPSMLLDKRQRTDLTVGVKIAGVTGIPSVSQSTSVGLSSGKP